MHFMTREMVNERLRLSSSASYRLLAPNRLHMVGSDEVISLLNRSAVRECGVDFVPSDIVTADELSEETGIPAKRLVAWTRRTKNVIPHYRLNKHTTRFRMGSVTEWIGVQLHKRERRRNGQDGKRVSVVPQ